MGFLGNRILVNGQPDYRVDVAARPYHLRVLNGSNSRLYRLVWSDGRPIALPCVQSGML